MWDPAVSFLPKLGELGKNLPAASRVGLQQSPFSTFPCFYIFISRSCKPTLSGFDISFEAQLGLDFRPSMLFDWFDRFILFCWYVSS